MDLSCIPEEILLKILEFLDYRDMLWSTLVSKKWNELISNSQGFLKNTKLVVVLEESRKTLNEMECAFNRKYQNVKFKCVHTIGFEELTPKIVGHMLKLKDSCKALSMEGIVFSYQSFEPMLDFIRQFQSLEELEILATRPTKNISKSEVKPAVMPKLKVLKMERNCDWMFKNLVCENLEVLNISTTYGSRYFESREKPIKSLIKFLNQHHNIKSLSLSKLNLECDEELLPKFKWKELQIYKNEKKCYTNVFKNWNNLINAADNDSKVFIETISGVGHFGGSPYSQGSNNFLLNFLNTVGKCEKITGMRINMNYTILDRYEDFYDRLKPMEWIKALEVYFSNDYRYCESFHANEVESFFRILPNVEDLYLDYEATRFFKSENSFAFTKVKNLRLQRATEHKPQKYLPALESMEIMNYFDDWRYILSAAFLKSVKIHLEKYEYLHRVKHNTLEDYRLEILTTCLPLTKKLELVKKNRSLLSFYDG